MILQKDRRNMMRWYVIRSKYRNEHLLEQQLHDHNVEVYCPCTSVHTHSSTTRKMKPYFPGYLFVHVDLGDVGLSNLQWIPGAIGLVCFGGEPAWITDELLHTLRAHLNQINTMDLEARNNLKPGDDIAIHSGPFAGYRGIFDSYLPSRDRVIIFLKFLRDQRIRVKIPVGQIAPTKTRSEAAVR